MVRVKVHVAGARADDRKNTGRQGRGSYVLSAVNNRSKCSRQRVRRADGARPS